MNMRHNGLPGGFGFGEDIASLKPDPEVQQRINVTGAWLMWSITAALDRLVENGVIIDKTKPHERERGQQSFAPGPTAIPGDWHRINGTSRGLRLNLLRSVKPEVSKHGEYIQLEFTGLEVVNGLARATARDFDRVKVDRGNGSTHVSGTSKGVKFNVDYPSAHSLFADFATAERLLSDAREGLSSLIPGGLPQPPEPPIISVPAAT